MKNIRLIALFITMLVAIAHPRPTAAETDCCTNFSLWCAGFCYNHGGTFFCQSWVGSGCSDLCLCGDQTMYEEHSGLCADCDR